MDNDDLQGPLLTRFLAILPPAWQPIPEGEGGVRQAHQGGQQAEDEKDGQPRGHEIQEDVHGGEGRGGPGRREPRRGGGG